MVTNPATRDWTVTASLFATLNEMFGNRTVCGIGRGDSAVRVTNGRPTTLATLRECDARHPGAGQRPGGRLQGRDAALPVGGREPARGLGGRLRARRRWPLTGEVADGFILQLADPDITAWTIKAVPRRRPRRPGATRPR